MTAYQQLNRCGSMFELLAKKAEREEHSLEEHRRALMHERPPKKQDKPLSALLMDEAKACVEAAESIRPVGKPVDERGTTGG